jgi:hypothetical protein
MKKIKFCFIFIIMYAMMFQNSQAQLLGKWVVPSSIDSDKVICELIFSNNSPITYNLLSNPSPTFAVPAVFSAGGYDGNYETDFYFIGNRLYSNSDDPPIEWVGTTFPLYHNFQLITKPMISNEYLAFLSKSVHPEDSWLCWISVAYDESTGIATPSGLNEFHDFDFNRAAFTIVEEANTDKYIYAASVGEDGVTYNASFKRWKIIETGVTEETTIIDESDDDLSEMDFDAYNLEHIKDANKKDVFAWSHAHTDAPVDEIVILKDGNPSIIDLDLGRIGGIEFSTYEDNMLYVSCTDYGIVKVNYTNGTIAEYVIYSDFERTYLQTAPDGHIYGVSNDGRRLGRIDMNNGSFDSQAFTFPNLSSVATYNEFYVGNEDLKYYVLPENERVFNELTVYQEIVNETCPGYSDGTASLYVSGGTPCQHPEQEYTIVCYLGEQPVEEDYYDDDDHYFFFSGLTAGRYTYTITDCIEGTIDGEFTILSTEFTHDEMYPVTSDLNWNNKNESFGKGITVFTGKTLTINNSVLEFGPEAKMIIEQGAKVYVDNSLLTNHTCEPLQKWQGIQVWGDPDDNQFEYAGHPLAQGKLVLTGSTIEHAVDAVLLAAKNEEGRIDASKTGGIVIANNSHFINNQKSVYGLYYQNMYPFFPDYEYDNLSSFKNCTFSINSNYIFEDEDDDFHKHIDLTHVKGFNFEGCDFSNTASDDVVSQYNCGIMAFDAGFTVVTYCSEPEIPCPGIESYFNGFYCAVWASSDGGTNNTFHINRANFTDNAIGVKASMIDNAAILFSDFDIGYNNNSHAMAECGDRAISYGVDMLGCTGFAVEENHFTTTQTTGDYIGVRVKDCPSVSDDIYKNEYEGLSVANLAEGANRSVFEDDGTGVSYICNHNSANDYDFHVAGISWIRGNMGSTTTPSGNVLTNPIISVVQLQNDFTQDIRYYYDVNNTNEWLVEYSNHVFPFPINYANTCPSHYGGGGGSVKDLVLSPEEKLDAEQDFYQSYTDFNNVEILFNNLKDGGNTDAMQTEIEMSWPDDMWELRAGLLGNSPHLSKEVLMAAADKTEVLPESVLFEILSANPDELRKEELIIYLENKNQPLPAYMIDILRQLANGMTYKTILLNQMSDYHHSKVNAAQDIIRSILNDSIIDKIELMNWLDNIGGYVADKQIISTYLADNDYSAAQNLLDILPALYNLEGNDLLAYNNYKTLVELQINLSQQERNIFGLTETELNVLVDIADNGYGTAKYSAQGMLEYAYGYEYCNCPSLPDSIGLKSSNLVNNDMIQAAGLDISAKPNPANTWVAFTYRLPVTISSATIIIADAAGKVMDKININEEQGQIIWDVRDIEPGIYIYSLKADNIIKRGKLIIQ